MPSMPGGGSGSPAEMVVGPISQFLMRLPAPIRNSPPVQIMLNTILPMFRRMMGRFSGAGMGGMGGGGNPLSQLGSMAGGLAGGRNPMSALASMAGGGGGNPLSALSGLAGGMNPMSALSGMTGGANPLSAVAGMAGGSNPLSSMMGRQGTRNESEASERNVKETTTASRK